MTGSTNRTCELAMPRGDIRPGFRKVSDRATGSTVGRLRTLLFGRRQEGQRLPPLKNAHYIGVHMAAATTHQKTLR